MESGLCESEGQEVIKVISAEGFVVVRLAELESRGVDDNVEGRRDVPVGAVLDREHCGGKEWQLGDNVNVHVLQFIFRFLGQIAHHFANHIDPFCGRVHMEQGSGDELVHYLFKESRWEGCILLIGKLDGSEGNRSIQINWPASFENASNALMVEQVKLHNVLWNRFVNVQLLLEDQHQLSRESLGIHGALEHLVLGDNVPNIFIRLD
mmetsp:Transcript_2255/g.2981  ORF Transcript_2255/g.2981 Transcript_2255/m.2981 type:complete len:208 (-) Transcript_2255:232-855(-)